MQGLASGNGPSIKVSPVLVDFDVSKSLALVGVSCSWNFQKFSKHIQEFQGLILDFSTWLWINFLANRRHGGSVLCPNSNKKLNQTREADLMWLSLTIFDHLLHDMSIVPSWPPRFYKLLTPEQTEILSTCQNTWNFGTHAVLVQREEQQCGSTTLQCSAQRVVTWMSTFWSIGNYQGPSATVCPGATRACQIRVKTMTWRMRIKWNAGKPKKFWMPWIYLRKDITSYWLRDA